jgi:hypothetical protein
MSIEMPVGPRARDIGGFALPDARSRGVGPASSSRRDRRMHDRGHIRHRPRGARRDRHLIVVNRARMGQL